MEPVLMTVFFEIKMSKTVQDTTMVTDER